MLPSKQPRKRSLFLNDGSCVWLRPERRNHVWSYDFVEDSTMDGRKLRFLNIIDEHTRECLANIPRRSWRGTDVMEALADIMLKRGCPEYIRSDNGPEFIAKRLRNWLSSLGVITTYIEPGSPWENGYCESFNNRMRDEFLTVSCLAICMKRRCWQNSGRITTTRSGHTAVWVVGRRPRRASF